MRLAQPPGIRSCREGGAWDACRGPSGSNLWIMEFEELMASSSGTHRTALRAEIYDLMKRAEQGLLAFKSSTSPGDVDQMGIAPRVLELRLRSRTGDTDGDQHVRLYFTEPEQVPACLLALKLAAKRPGPIGLFEQDGHAQEADRRLDDFFIQSS